MTTDYATALAIHHGTTNLQQALAADRAKVRGDLRQLRGRFGQTLGRYQCPEFHSRHIAGGQPVAAPAGTTHLE